LARRHLADLEEAGIVHRIGTGAGTRYELTSMSVGAPSDPVEKIDMAALTVALPPPARSIPRTAPELLPAGPSCPRMCCAIGAVIPSRRRPTSTR
jgi:hypothetical protein